MKKFYFVFFPLFFFSQKNDFKTLLNAGDSRFSIKNYREAYAEYDKAFQLISADFLTAQKKSLPISVDWKHCLTRHAQTAFYSADYTAANRDADLLLQLDSGDVNAKAIKGYSLYKSGEKIAGCLQIAGGANKLNPFVMTVYDDCYCWTEGVAQFREAVSACNLSRYNEALRYIDNAIFLLPDSVSYQLKKGEICMKLENYPLAFTQFNECVKRDSSNFRAWFFRGIAHQKAGRLEQAFADLSFCVGLNPGSFDAYRQRAEICEELQQFQSAIYDYQQCLKLEKTNGEMHYRIALIRKNDIQDEIGACSEFAKAAALGFEEAVAYVEECKNPKKKNKK